ncbi:amino acid adenylation domain-containing protein [Bacillus swezeyi]|nr:amino acid adenylation domain-containing protein [Bacillus swezeyi]
MKRCIFLVEKFGYFPLSHPQKRIMNIEALYPDTPINHIGGVIKIEGKLHLSYLQQAIQLCIQQTEALRIRLVKQDQNILQYIGNAQKVSIPIIDFAAEESPHEKMLEWAEREFKIPFSLFDNPLAQFCVLNLDESSCAYFIKCHHTIADGWSMKIIIDKIKYLYQQLADGDVPEDSSDDYSVLMNKEKSYMTSSRFKKDADFWKNEFSHLPESFLTKSSEKISGKRKTFKIDPECSKEIYQFIDEQGCSLNALFTASLLCYLSKVTGQNDLIIGTPVLNRSGKKEKSTAGMTVSTMPFRQKTDFNQRFSDFLHEINHSYLKYFLHQKYPYDELIKELHLVKEGFDQLFQIYINSYSTNLVTDISGYHVDYIELYNGFQPYSLQVAVKEWDGGGAIELQFDYKESDYIQDDIRYLYERLIILLQKAMRNPGVLLKDLTLLTEQEKIEEIYTWNQTDINYPKEKVIYELFHDQAAQTPLKPAIEDGERQVLYSELDERSNQMARHLIEKGLERGDFAAVCMKHSPELISVLLGILKAGGAYVPIDPEYPAERIQYILEDSEASYFITDQSFETADTIPVKNIRIDPNCCLHQDKNRLETINNPCDVAYMIYTSGSTGQPKGVMIEHQSLVNYITSASKNYLSSQDEHFALYSSIAFDLTVTSVFTPLITGNKIVIYRQEDTSEFILQRVLKEKKATIIKLTPAHLALLKDQDFFNSAVKRLIVGGEQLPTDLAKSITESAKQKIAIFNEYGPTEATVGCMIHKFDINNDLQHSVPIGIPMQNTQIYLLNDQLQPISPGIAGEMYISGDNVSRGYWKRPEIQKERFLNNPFIENKKMYKTGDLAKKSVDGKLEYLGRKDHQIKIRGYRIELGEIELALLSLHDVKEAVVIDFDDQHGHKQLAAYVVKTGQTSSLQLRKKLSVKLPAFMVPTYFVSLDSIPLTSNGKMDREALPDPVLYHDQSRFNLNNRQQEFEVILLETAREVLGKQDIKPEDHFYQLGGDSIKAIQFVSKMKEKGLSVKTQDLLTYPIFRELVSVAASQPAPEIPQHQAEGKIMDTPITSWFWSLQLNRPDFWHQSVLLSSTNEISVEETQEILNILSIHHDALNISVEKETNHLFYDHRFKKINVESYDFSALTENQLNKKIERIGQYMRENTDLYNGSLLKVSLMKTANQTLLLFTAHHLIADGVSWQIFIDDFLALWHAGECKSPDILPSKTHSYQAYAKTINEFANSDELSGQCGYWEEEVKRIEPLYGRPARVSKVKDSSKIKRKLDVNLTQKLLSTANQAYQTQINDLLLTGLISACRRCTGKTVISLELEGHGREPLDESYDFSRTFGWFTGMYPVTFNTVHDLSAQIRSVKETVRKVPKKGIGYGVLTYMKGQMPTHVQPEMRFNYLGEIDQFLAGKPEYKLSYLNSGNESSLENMLTVNLDLTASIHDQQLVFDLIYSSGLYKTKEMEDLLDELLIQLNKLVEHCCEKEFVEYTPSDFETASLSLEEMDSLFK